MVKQGGKVATGVKKVLSPDEKKAQALWEQDMSDFSKNWCTVWSESQRATFVFEALMLARRNTIVVAKQQQAEKPSPIIKPH